ncbi:MAG: MFS transporter [Treponema sp.]|jgi:GPH family glycoside/pentoside/hexuronide:cation symporter|nr:MFS transporter [Treponema sp.]
MSAVKEKSSVPAWFYPAFASKGVGIVSVSALLNYVTFFATNYLGLSPALVGTLMLFSKIFDGFTDILAGFIIDHTNTRLGRARPYEISVIFYCFFTVVIFSVPDMGAAGTAAFVFIVYTLIFSVFSTLLTCSEPVYLARAVKDDATRVKVLSFSGLIYVIPTVAVSAILPQLIATIGATRAGWRTIALILCIPATIIGMIRFITIKEIVDADPAGKQKIGLKEGAMLLFKNKYILIFSLALLLTNIAQNHGSGPYYFTYIVGDISMQSVTAIGTLLATMVLLFIPALSKKLGLAKVMKAGLILGAAGYLLPLIAPRLLPLLALSSMLSLGSIIPIWMLAGAIVINCMDYGEWRSGKRGEGIYSCASGVSSKVGIGLGAAISGGILALGGFDRMLPVQNGPANTAIMLLYTAIPAGFLLISFIVMQFYNLDKKMPVIQQELAERKIRREEDA